MNTLSLLISIILSALLCKNVMCSPATDLNLNTGPGLRDDLGTRQPAVDPLLSQVSAGVTVAKSSLNPASSEETDLDTANTFGLFAALGGYLHHPYYRYNYGGYCYSYPYCYNYNYNPWYYSRYPSYNYYY